MIEPAPSLTTVVVVDGSPVRRRFLRSAVESDPELVVVGEARNGKEAVALVARLRPSVVLMDLELPVMSGIEAIEQIMAASPTAILVWTGRADRPGGDSQARADGLQAIAAGAVDVLERPGPDDRGSLDRACEQLRRQVRLAARVRVITHPRGKLRAQGLMPAPLGLATAGGPGLPLPEPTRTGIQLFAVGSSTGGPQALATLLRGLPADLEQAVLVVQHMADGFIPGLASWLDELVPLPVTVGVSGRRLLPGTVTIAPSGGNLLVQDDRLRVLCTVPEPGQFHVPGIDQCFASIAEALGPLAVGVLLTGMGRDGASGLLAMRERGAATVGQDAATSTVYGMPQVAFEIGAVASQLGIGDIPGELLTLVGRS